MSTVPSAAEQMRTVLFNRMNRNESDEAFDKALLIQLSADSSTRLSAAQSKSTMTTISTVQALLDMGFDKDDRVVTNLLDANEKMVGTLVKLGEAAARHAN